MRLPPGAARTLVDEVARRADEALAGFAAVRAEVAGDTSPEQAFRTMTLSYGEPVARAQRAWADESLAVLDALEAAPAPRPEEAGRARG